MKKIAIALVLALVGCTTVDDGTNGPDAGTTPTVDGSVTPAGHGIAWSGGTAKLVVSGDICPGQNGQALVVGECLAAGAHGWVGTGAAMPTVSKGADGNYVIPLSGNSAEDCTIDLYKCAVTVDVCPAGADWSNQGCNRLYEPGTHNGGPFMGYVEGQGSPIMFHYAPGAEPTPMGVQPNGP